MEKKTVSKAIVESLIANGVDTVFGIPGAHTYDLTNAMHDAKNELRFIHSRHEQGAGYMAYGYAKSSGKPGVFTVVPGPGVLNAGAALCTAYGANTPVMCLTGNIMSHLIGQGRGQLHELPDQLAMLRGLTKWSDRIDHATEAPGKMENAFAQMTSDRQRPVAIEVPWDMFASAATIEDARPAAPHKPAVDPDQIARAVELLKAAKNPMIMVGGGAADASNEILALAEKLQAPVVAHRSGKGVVSDRSSYSFNLVAGYEYWKDCDLLLGIGSRLELQFMRWNWQPKGLTVVRVDIDPTEMVRLKPDHGIVGDAALSVAALCDALREFAPASRVAEFDEFRENALGAIQVVRPQMSYLDAIRAALPDDGFFVEEVSQMGFTGRFGFPVFAPRQYVTCGYQDNLGFGFNTALGVKVAHPDKVVVSVSGDGGFMFGVQELATAKQHNIAVIAIVFNNKAYGNVRRDQMTVFNGNVIGADLENPDFVALAQSFGLQAARVCTADELQVQLDNFIALKQPCVIEVDVETGSETPPWTFLHPAPHSD